MIKNLTSLIFLFNCIFCSAQQKILITTYPATYDGKVSDKISDYYIVKVFQKELSDTLWPLEMYFNTKAQPLAATGSCRDSSGLIRQGSFNYFHEKGKKWKEYSYVQSQKHGLYQQWNEDGLLTAKENYSMGKMIGLNLRWNKNGTISDSIVLDQNGTGTAKTFFDSGKVSGEGNYKEGLKSGEWNYYYKELVGKKCMTAQLIAGEAKSFVCYDEDGNLQKKDCEYEKEAEYPGGNVAWQQYLVKKLGRANPQNYLSAGKRYKVIIKFVIDQDGKPADAVVEEPGSIADLNEYALKIIRNSGEWIPAVQYNRRVKAYRRQPITFAVD